MNKTKSQSTKRQQQCREAHAGLQREAWTVVNELIPYTTELLQQNAKLKEEVRWLKAAIEHFRV